MKFFISNLVLFFSLMGYSNSCVAEEHIASALQEESNFQKLSVVMKEKSLGLLLMLHAEDCPYCILMENEILSPMVKSGEYDKTILIRKLQIDGDRDIIDFSGKTLKSSDISKRYKLVVTPTLVFLDSKGNEVIKQMVGINTVEMFSAYLDIEIDKLIEKLH